MKLRVKEICKKKGITQKQLAGKLYTSDISLRASLKGNPTVNTLEKVANALEVNITDLFEPNKGEITALIDYNDSLYRFDNIAELERFIESIKTK